VSFPAASVSEMTPGVFTSLSHRVATLRLLIRKEANT